jgi:sterol desaturase/sphingolipid hydroxylase (fatty acid hydroxylase superfamily)
MDAIFVTLENLKAYSFLPYAAPFFFVLVALEYILTTRKKLKVYDIKDALAATCIGLGNVGLGILIKGFNFLILLYFFSLTPLRIEPSWWSFILCFLAVDLVRYWAHRITHEQRVWWATHVTHHSSPVYNFTVGFRLGWTQYIKIIFFVPIPLLGFDPITFFICHQIAVIYQFWIHTTLINKMPAPIEYIFVTPSHHRVHHGTNPQYIDKNYGSTFIFWDRIFGTFEPENEPVVYGITKPIKYPYNPFFLVFHEWYDVFRDVRKSGSFRQAWRILFASPAESEALASHASGLPAAPPQAQQDFVDEKPLVQTDEKLSA